MNKKLIITGVILVIVLAIGGGVWMWQKNEVKKQEQVKIQQIQQEEAKKEEQNFVVDVDPDVSHWQTKGEKEAFTIKFPKEWYWMESSHSEREGYSRVITNNPSFDMVKYADIGVGTGGNYPITLVNNAEVVISFNGSATSDAGTPQDRIDSIFKLTKQSDPSAKCSIYNNKTIPFTVYCSSTHDSQLQQSYYVINKEVSIVFTARTTKDTLVKKEILDKIAGSIILK